MTRFLIEAHSPDGYVSAGEIEDAMRWLQNHDGVAWRGYINVTEIEEDYNPIRIKDGSPDENNDEILAYEEKNLFLEVPCVPITKSSKPVDDTYKIIRSYIPKDIVPINYPRIEFNAVFEFKGPKNAKYLRCDVDNLAKAVIDAVKGRMFIGDDSIITKVTVEKKLSYRDMTTIHIATERIDK
jgi:Holliday junction resolvase RusA-like endonuclease